MDSSQYIKTHFSPETTRHIELKLHMKYMVKAFKNLMLEKNSDPRLTCVDFLKNIESFNILKHIFL